MEICKTVAKNSSPGLFNFFIVLAGHDKVTDTGRLSRASATSKAHHYQQKLEKMRTSGKQGL